MQCMKTLPSIFRSPSTCNNFLITFKAIGSRDRVSSKTQPRKVCFFNWYFAYLWILFYFNFLILYVKFFSILDFMMTYKNNQFGLIFAKINT